MKTVAYVRVSTDTQDVTHQRLAILEFARTERLAVDAFLEVQASARRSGQVRQLDVLLGSLAPGDALIVSELSRLGRSVGEIITLVARLMHHQGRVFALKAGLRLTGVQEVQSRVMVTLFSLCAEIERALLSLRTKEALATARGAGKRLGRPPGARGTSKREGKEHEMHPFLALQVSKASIAKITGVDRATLYHCIRSRGLMPQ
jgi:DNA invertase Pin-like site-specific DNA recombinase